MDDERMPILSRSMEAAQRSRWRTQVACGCVLVVKMFERIAFYGVVANLVLFLNHLPLNWVSYNAANALFVFTGIAYMISVLGGWLADSYLGKFKTILLGFVIYAVGYTILPLISNSPYTHHSTIHCQSLNQTRDPSPGPGSEKCAGWIYSSLTVIALGVGFVSANIAPFGAEQVLHEGPHVTRKFFNWFYWCINFGCLLSLGLIAYIQQIYNFFWGFIAPGICLLVGIVIFTIGRLYYMVKPASGSVLSNVFRILIQACQRSRTVSKRNNNESSPENLKVGCLDYAKVRHGGSHNEAMVDDVRILFKVILIFVAMIPYWVVYFQMETTYTLQGLHMRLSLSDNGNKTDPPKSQIAAAWLSLFDVIFLVVLIPVMDQLVYPALDKRGLVLSLRARITIGMVFAVVSMVVAGGVESRRLDLIKTNHTYNQMIGNTTFYAADLSIFIQIPQYALIGVSEVFASIAGLELAYALAPRSMQGLIMGLFSFTQGIASFLGTASTYVFKKWFFDYDHGDIYCPKCHLDFYFYFLAGVQFVGVIVFVIFAWGFNIGGPDKTRPVKSSSSPKQIRKNNRYRSVQNNSHIPEPL